MVKKIYNTNILAAITIGLLFHFVFGFGLYSFIGLAAGFFLGLLVLNERRWVQILATLLSTGAIFFIGSELTLISAILIGINLTYYYRWLTQQYKFNTERVNILNILFLTGIVFQSSIAKLRGANKLNLSDIQLTVPLVILTAITVFFLVKAIYANVKSLKAKYKTYIAIIAILLLSGVYSYVSYFFYKEIGTENILIPLLAGVLVGVIQIFVHPKSMITDLNELLLLTILPYQISGLMGISLAFLSSILFTGIIAPALKPEIDHVPLNINKIAPMLFLFAAAEMRENEGLITRFNLVTGYQVGWLLISLSTIHYMRKAILGLKRIFTENEIPNMFPLTALLFTLSALTIIIRFGRDEALASLLLGGIVYLFITNLQVVRRQKAKLLYAMAVSNVIGSIAFLVLTKV